MKEWVRRKDSDRSQGLRRALQFAFLLLNLWIGWQFFHFVAAAEGGHVSDAIRPAGVEGWLPIAGMMNTRYLVLTGEVPRIHPAAMVLFLSFLLISFLMRKAFCGWLCPVGTISEYLWKLGRETFRRVFFPPKWVDVPLRGLKYVLLGFFVYAVFSMPAEALEQFLSSPYGLIADVKMLNFFRYLSVTGAVVIGVLAMGSVFVPNFWCRYLCPYGALMGLAAMASPLRIRRTAEACIDCAKCAKACPAGLPVDQLIQIRSAECLGCMECVTACPAEGALEMRFVPARRRVAPQWIAAGVAFIFLGFVGVAKLTGHWDSLIPVAMYERLVPHAHELDHPR
jgi:polyferredoxin